MMNKYLVNLRLQIGEVSKTSHHFVEAPSAVDAGILAMSHECHSEAELVSKVECIDMHGEMAYRVTSVIPLSQKELDGIENLFTVYQYVQTDITDVFGDISHVMD